MLRQEFLLEKVTVIFNLARDNFICYTSRNAFEETREKFFPNKIIQDCVREID